MKPVSESDEASEDQIAVCRSYAERQGWTVVDWYADRAISGASLLRPGIQSLMEDAGKGSFDIVFAEALDRLSRDQEDVAGVFKRLSFVGVQMITLSEGEISELHVGLEGLDAAFVIGVQLRCVRSRGVVLRKIAISGKHPRSLRVKNAA